MSKKAAPKSKTPKQANGMALAAFILGIASIVLGWIPIIGWAIIILTIIFGILGIQETRKEHGRWMAVTGLVLAGVSVLLMILAILSMVLFFTTITNGGFTAGGVTERVEYGNAVQVQEIVDATEPLRIINVEGVGIHRIISSEEPVDLRISGMGNSVELTEGTPVHQITIEGMDNTLTVPLNTIITDIQDTGVNTKIIRE